MEFTINTLNVTTEKADCIIIPVLQGKKLSDAGQQLDKISQGYLKKILQQGDLKEELGQWLILRDIPNVKAPRLLVISTGKETLTDKNFHQLMSSAIKALTNTSAKNVISTLAELKINDHDYYWKTRQAIQATEEVMYKFTALKSEKATAPTLKKLTFSAITTNDVKLGQLGIEHGQAISRGVNLAKELGNLPANVCTPTYLAHQAQSLAKQYPKMKATIHSETEIKKLKMGALLSVARGSKEPPKLITLEYRHGKKTQKPYVLVGKGVTFDSGGISLKPGTAMDEMKYDMCGAASVLGTLSAVAEMKLPINVVAVIPATENLPSGEATKPGDIVTSMSGQTIEILNTDAEGRLILCDALTYCKKFNPEIVIDIATLTGAIVIGLGNFISGMMSNDENLAKDLVAAGLESVDETWRFPMNEDYNKLLSSNFADVANISGGREAGSITAACFLNRFTKDYRWAHLDIAGVAWKSGKDKGATGRPVPLLTQYLIDKSK